MQKINDLQTSLEEEIDLSDSLNLDFKISKLSKKNISDLDKSKKNIDISLKKIIKLQKSKTKNFDTFSDSKKQNIDLIKPKKEEIIKRKVAKFKFIFTHLEFSLWSWYKRFFIIFIFIIFLIFWNKVLVERLIINWYENILAVKDDFSNKSKLISDIKSAKTDFFLANIFFKPFSIIPNKNIENANYLIASWNNLSDILENSLNIYELLNSYIEKWNKIEEIDFITFFKSIRDDYENINSSLYKALWNFYKVWDLGNKELNEKLEIVQEKLKLALSFVDKIYKNYDTILSIFGENEEKTYLVVFQNNDEIRATWGFMWSMTFVTFSNWKIKNIEKTDVYAMKWLLDKNYKNKEKTPKWLDKVTEYFWIQDANYYPEFKESSKKIKYFLNKIPKKIDGVIYMNQNIVLDLLKAVGWVKFDTIWETINEKNFSLIISTLVEAEVYKVWTLWTPKEILFQFADKLYNKLMFEKKYYDYLEIILKNIKSRDLVFYSFNPKENSFLWKIWVNWEMNFWETLDFNYPVFLSIWWNKTDRYMKYTYSKSTENINSTCDFITKLDIKAENTFSPLLKEKILDLLKNYDNVWKDESDILNIQGLWENKSFLRILIPKNASVYPYWNQIVQETENYKIVEFYTNTKSSKTSNYSIKYRLKNPKCSDYNYKIYKQPGLKDYNLNLEIQWKIKNYENINTDFIYNYWKYLVE